VPPGEHRPGENGAIMKPGLSALAVGSRLCLVGTWGIPATLCRCRFTSAARWWRFTWRAIWRMLRNYLALYFSMMAAV